MLTEFLKSTDLIQIDDLSFFFCKAVSNRGKRLDTIKKYCITNRYSIIRSFKSIVSFLSWINLIEQIDHKYYKRNPDYERIIEKPNSQQFFQNIDFIRLILDQLKRDQILDLIFNAKTLRRNEIKQTYLLIDKRIPLLYKSLVNMLIQIGFINYDDDEISVAKLYSNLFEKEVMQYLLKMEKKKRKFSIDNLKRQQDQNNLYGIEAEKFVLSYELNRLSEHHNRNLIKIISDSDVSAGYDIVSFDGLSSCFPDRYIEVKSYINELSFFFSKNELETSKIHANNYFIYFVDRNRMKEIDYHPLIIQNPFVHIFCSSNWRKYIDNWYIKLENRN